MKITCRRLKRVVIVTYVTKLTILCWAEVLLFYRRNPVTCFPGNDGKQCHDSSKYHHVNTRSVSKNTHVSINPFLSMYFKWVFHLIFAKTETHANGIISIMQPLGFICSVINCLTGVGGTDVSRNVYLSKQYYQSACYTYIY